MAQSDQVQNLVNNLTTTAPSGPPQARSMSDLLAVTGWGSASADGGGVVGQFQFTPDELRGLIKDWEVLRDDLIAASRTARRMVGVTPPADEDASEGFANKANESGQAYLQHNQEMRDYMTAYITKLQDTLDSYTNAEQAGADHARRIQNNL